MKIQIQSVNERTTSVRIDFLVTLENGKSHTFFAYVYFTSMKKYHPDNYDGVVNEAWQSIKSDVDNWVSQTNFVDGLLKVVNTSFTPSNIPPDQKNQKTTPKTQPSCMWLKKVKATSTDSKDPSIHP